ncbi:sulfotransferase domain-containing protein [Petrotoga sibirica]|uniref:Sulfotransferase domain-containing protein n=2 Tax=Petrotoga sibirica TaxID=156202 RepID=A0A4R8EQU7_9BACT|nr:sulfotransferase domain-containing protein [Petrotoga sibirica]POZ88400.1 hypothetical protein AA80_06415 [Petrotoga sibirica DSM 13575]TDX12101.1 sulfotransferase domain-containing protein [Petrotoga sibirica]
MKKLLIHIGYPKTATTTIQHRLFATLHETERINYLGRADYSANTYFEQAVGLENYLCLNENFHVNNLKIFSEKNNVISNEVFTASVYTREILLGRRIVDPLEYPQRLSTLFKNVVDNIEIMVTIRNQKDLIYSHYVQNYPWLANDKSNDAPTKFIFEDGQILRKERFKIFYFSDLLDKYEENFGKENIHILLFEDLKCDTKFFYDQLSQIINVESSLVERLLAGGHLNNRRKTNTGYYRETRKANALGKVVKKFRETNIGNKIINSYKEKYGSNSKMLNTIRKLMYKEDYIFIPKLSEEEKNIIFQEFRESNLKLSEKYHIDQEKLKKYGYI